MKNKKLSKEDNAYCRGVLVSLETIAAHGESEMWKDVLDNTGCKIEELVVAAKDIYNMYASGLIAEGYVDINGNIIPEDKREDAQEENWKYHPLYGSPPPTVE